MTSRWRIERARAGMLVGFTYHKTFCLIIDHSSLLGGTAVRGPFQDGFRKDERKKANAPYSLVIAASSAVVNVGYRPTKIRHFTYLVHKVFNIRVGRRWLDTKPERTSKRIHITTSQSQR